MRFFQKIILLIFTLEIKSKLLSVHEITVVAVRVVKLSHKILFFTKSLEHEWQRYLIYVSIVTILHCDFPRQVCVQWANLFRKNCMLIKPGFCESLDDPLQPFIARVFFTMQSLQIYLSQSGLDGLSSSLHAV